MLLILSRREMACGQFGSRIVTVGTNRSVDRKCTTVASMRANNGYQRITDGALAAPTERNGDGAFGSGQPIQQLRLVGFPEGAQSDAEYEPSWKLP